MGIPKIVNDDYLSKYLINLAYSQIILEHASTDSPAEFIKNIKEELAPEPETTSPVSKQITPPPKNKKLKAKLLSLTKNKKIFIPTSIFALLIIFTGASMLYANLNLKNKLLPKTYYAGIKLSQNPDSAKKEIQQKIDSFQLKLNYQNQTKTFKPEELGLKIDADRILDSAKISNNKVRFWQKPLYLFKTIAIESSSEVDSNKLREFLNLNEYGDKVPEDAKLEFSSQSNQFEIIPEIAGRGIDSNSLAKKLTNHSLKLSTEVINLQIENVIPNIQINNLTLPQKEANDFINQKIIIQGAGQNFSTTPNIKKDWLSLTPQPESSTIEIILNESAQNDYLNSIVRKVNRNMENKLFATIDGQEMQLSSGVTGISVTNQESAKQTLLSLTRAHQAGSIKLEYTEQQPGSENVAASGGRWIFADISQFKLYAYEGTNLINSFSMSSGKSSTPTPTGTYQVMSKVRKKTMRGGTPGRPDYYSVPNIEWIAYFKSGGYAMHGVYWHNKFGVENTSHGCMGMSNSNAKWVYDFIEVGTPVIIVQ